MISKKHQLYHEESSVVPSHASETRCLQCKKKIMKLHHFNKFQHWKMAEHAINSLKNTQFHFHAKALELPLQIDSREFGQQQRTIMNSWMCTEWYNNIRLDGVTSKNEKYMNTEQVKHLPFTPWVNLYISSAPQNDTCVTLWVGTIFKKKKKTYRKGIEDTNWNYSKGKVISEYYYSISN